MIFGGIVKSSLIDFPGKIATVLFTPGCNYDCFYCHNRALIEDIEETVDQKQLADFLEKRRGLIDAIVITGGEPTLHYDLIPFLLKVKAMGFATKLDSNGSNPDVIRDIVRANAVDYFAIDYKAPAGRYAEISGKGANAADVLETIRFLISQHQTFEVRTTVVPQLSLPDLLRMAQELPKVPRYVLNPYRKPKRYRMQDQDLVDAIPYSEKQIQAFAEEMKLYQEHVVLPF